MRVTTYSSVHYLTAFQLPGLDVRLQTIRLSKVDYQMELLTGDDLQIKFRNLHPAINDLKVVCQKI